jgi:hypothetical protein
MIKIDFKSELNPRHIAQLTSMVKQEATQHHNDPEDVIGDFITAMVDEFGLSDGADLGHAVIKKAVINDAVDLLKSRLIPKLMAEGRPFTRTQYTVVQGMGPNVTKGRNMNTLVQDPPGLEEKAAAILADRAAKKDAKRLESEAKKVEKAAAKAVKDAERAAAKAAKAANPAPTPRKSAFSGKTLRISASVAENGNPRKVGSHGHKSMQILIDAGPGGVSYEEYISEGGRSNDLQWDIAHGNVVVQ